MQTKQEVTAQGSCKRLMERLQYYVLNENASMGIQVFFLIYRYLFFFFFFSLDQVFSLNHTVVSEGLLALQGLVSNTSSVCLH